MRAVVFDDFKTLPVLKDIEKPTPGPGEVLLKVAGAGACHSDVAIFQDFEANNPAGLKPGFVLGHENSGWVEEVGPGVSGINKGEAYLIYGPIGCQHCRACSRGQDTYCENAATNPYLGVGLGRNGGMAEYVTAPARNLVRWAMLIRLPPRRCPTPASRRTTPSSWLCQSSMAAESSRSSLAWAAWALWVCRS